MGRRGIREGMKGRLGKGKGRNVGIGEGSPGRKARKVGWGGERGVLEKEMKGKIGRREGEEEKTLRVKWENERRGRRCGEEGRRV